MEDASDPSVPPWSDLTRRWLSHYYACCRAEAEESHGTVLARVLPAIEAAVAASSSSPPAAAASSSPTAAAAAAGISVDLDFTGMHMTLSEWSAALRSCVHALPLRCLTLRDTNVGDAGLRALCKAIAVSGAGRDAQGGSDRLPACSPACPSRLETLNMSGAGLTDASPLSLLVAACPRLRHLDLSCNHLGASPDGLAGLCSALQYHARCEHIDLSSNTISGERGGRVMQALSELLVGRSLVPLDEAQGGSLAATVESAPLRVLTLSHNMLGAYYYTGGGLSKKAGVMELRSQLCRGSSNTLEGAGRVCHDTIADFPLITALYLNNSLLAMDLRDNGLPDGVLDYVQARLHVNQRTHQLLNASHSGTRGGTVSVGRVKASLQESVQRVLQRVLDTDIQQATALTCAASEGGAAATPLAAKQREPRWTTQEVTAMLTAVVQSVSAELELA